MVDIKQFTNEEFSIINDEISKNIKGLFFERNNSFGIFYNNTLIGLIGLDNFLGSLSFNVALLDKYRGKGFAVLAMDKFLEKNGKKYKDFEKFLCITNPNDYSANRSLEKSDWISTYEYDEVMLYEGGAFYNIYFKINPYYGKRLIKNDKK